MSLLLEALKKAELAKQQNPPAPQSEAPPSTSELCGRPAQRGAAEHYPRPFAGHHAAAGDSSTDLPSARRDVTRESAAAAPTTAPPGDIARPAASLAGADNADRRSARALFEAKAVDYNPRRPFYWTAGALGGIALLTVAYFAYQLYVPRASFYTGPVGGRRQANRGCTGSGNTTPTKTRAAARCKSGGPARGFFSPRNGGRGVARGPSSPVRVAETDR